MANTCNGRTQSRIKGTPDYDDAEYWDTKFATGQDVGEWLNSGETLLEAVLAALEQQGHEKEPSVLHLGPGISKLGTKLCDEFAKRGWTGRGIVNVDFSSEAVRLGQEYASQKETTRTMHWLRADLCSWEDVLQLSRFVGPGPGSASEFGADADADAEAEAGIRAPFDVIFDKSTSDAIATSSSRDFTFPVPPDTCPAIRQIVEKSESGGIALFPVELVALNLVPWTRKGTTWIALSYSSARFSNLPYLTEYWTVLSRTSMQAPSGKVFSSSTHVPQIFHWIYVLQRK